MDCNYYSTYQSDVLNIFHLFYMKFFDFFLFFVNFQSDCKDMNRLWQDG